MEKKQYMKPAIEVLRVEVESLLQTYSIDNTGNGGEDGEKYTVTDGDLGEGEEVGAKGSNAWDVWE